MAKRKTTGEQRDKKPGGVTGKGWKPGQSGNPKGRPRTAKFSEAMQQLWEEIGKSGDSKAMELAAHCLQRAMGGSVRHAELSIAYVEGKPRQAYDINHGYIDDIAARVKRARERAQMREDAEEDAEENDGEQVRIHRGKGKRDGKQ